MSWAAIDDRLHADPRRFNAGLEAMGVWAMARSWIAGELTDGHIPAEAARSLSGGRQEAIDRLVDAGFWAVAEGGYTDVDYLRQNLPKEEILARRAARAAAGAKGGVVSRDVRRKEHGTAQPSKQTPKQVLRAAEANLEASAEANLEPPYPVPLSPEPLVPNPSKLINPPQSAGEAMRGDDEGDGVATVVFRWLVQRVDVGTSTKTRLDDVLAEFDIEDARPVIAALNKAERLGKVQGHSAAEVLSYITANANGSSRGSLLARELDDSDWRETQDEIEPVRVSR